MTDRAVLDRAHDLLVATAAELDARPDHGGYVELQTVPYRSHHLLAAAVLAHTRPGSVVLEGGVSSGYFARVLTAAGLVVDGAELDPAAAARARSVCRHVWCGDLQHVDPAALAGPYDAIVFGDTLEHLADPVPVLRRLRTVLAPGGVLVASIPNVANWAIRLQLLAGRFRYTDRGILDRSHLRFYTESSVRELLRDAGFVPRDVHAAVPVPFVRSAPLCRVADLVGNLRPSLFAYSFVVTGTAA
jgi:SAM-dependent methyltransferase